MCDSYLWYDEEVYGHDLLRVVGQERSPRLARRLGLANHVGLDGRFRRGSAECGQFSYNVRRAPSWVHGSHGADKRFDFIGNGLSAQLAFLGQPLPMLFGSPALPANDGVRLHKDECVTPTGPDLCQDAPQDSVCWLDFDTSLSHCARTHRAGGEAQDSRHEALPAT